ncbi:VOC family protein [Chloroflexus sp.]|uniref:VOC family protein n=1 Tax=Chloroflexus sp. TaxID=1904827 RepID=UPI002ADDCA72|nr:VOC family protein [Chloroflexus sp.]
MDEHPYAAAITFIPVTDLQASARCYADALGLPLVLDQGGIHIYRVARGSYLGLCQCAEPVIADDRLILTIVSSDVDTIYERLVAAGIATDGPPRENPRYRIYHFFARDLDGYRLEVQRFLHPFDEG